jgi:hypothetical protein
MGTPAFIDRPILHCILSFTEIDIYASDVGITEYNGSTVFLNVQYRPR